MFKKVNSGVSIFIAVVFLLVMAFPVFAQTPTPPAEANGNGLLRSAWLSQLAEALNMSVDELKSEIQSGKTVAELAGEKGVNLDSLIKNLTQKTAERLNQAVAQGKITQQQADQRLSTLKNELKNWFTSGDMPNRVKAGLTVVRDGKLVADALGMTELDLLKALRNGQTVAQLAEEKGVSLDTLVNTVVDQHAEALTKAVEAGKITQEQADQRLQNLKEQLTQRFEDGNWRFAPGNDNRRNNQSSDSGQNDGASL